jgi:DNA-binding beta-propeller fold protein YncE
MLPRDLAVDANSVYYVSYDGSGVLKVSLNGVAQASVTSDGGPYGLFVDSNGGRVYVANFDLFRVESAPLAGGSVTIHVQQLPSPPRAVIFWQNGVYYSLGDRIQRVGSGSTAIDFATGQAGATGMTADASGMYWANASTAGTIVRANASGITVIASNQGTPTSIALTASSIYWTNSTTGEIMRLAK